MQARSLAAVALAVFACSGSLFAAGKNLVPNSGFEDGRGAPEHWQKPDNYTFFWQKSGGVKGKFVDLGFDQDNYESWHWWTDVYILTPVPPRDEIRWVLPDWPRYPDRKRR